MTWLMFAAIVFYAADSAFAAVSPYGYLDDGKEPPANPFLANSPWPMTHRNPYGQASSPYAGPSEEDELEIDFLGTALGTITLAYTNRDANGNYAIWENNAFHTAKIQDSGLSLSMIDKVSGGLTLDGLANAYYLLDNEGFLFVPKMRTLRSFTDAVSGDHLSGVVEVDMYELPDWALASPSDSLVGLSLMYDGYLVFSTAQGMVGVIRRDFTDLKVVQLGQGDEEVSNSFAVDEDGGIYVVTSKHMYRVQWNGSNLAVAWTANYEVGPEEQVGGRLGAGSGSTPTLMGTGAQDDKFVVITDGQPLMHLVLFWRDEIPVGWRPIAPDKDLRIAAEVPITFGDATAETSVSEQSVLVRGYGAVVVNNDYGIRLPEWVPDFFNQFMVGVTNLPGFAPYGVEKFEWNPGTRQLESVWTNRETSCPNGIPTMSVATNLIYCIGQRNAVWNIEALDWDTGRNMFHKQAGVLPRYNSAYAATEIGPGREIVSGSFGGVFRARVK